MYERVAKPKSEQETEASQRTEVSQKIEASWRESGQDTWQIKLGQDIIKKNKSYENEQKRQNSGWIGYIIKDLRMLEMKGR